MANNELAIRFTEESYATKADVSRELGLTLVDNIWSNILKYRSTYYRYLSLKSIDKNQLMVCYCQSLNSALTNMDAKLLKQMGDYVKLNRINGDLSHFEDMCIIKALGHLAAKNHIEISEPKLRGLIQGDYRDFALDKKIFKRYADSLIFIRDNYSRTIDIDFLADLYSVFTENPELTSFYRTTEDRNPINRVLIDRIYSSAPVVLIEPLMNQLFLFISTSTLTTLVKSIITYYFVNYVRPFPQNNEEIAMLLMKAVLANGSLSEFGAIAPLENLLALSPDSLSKVCVEVQKTNDLTYFINYILKALESSLEEIADIKAIHTTDILRNDFYREEPAPQPKVVEQPAPAPAPAPVQTVVIEQPAPAPTQEAPKVVVQIQPVAPTPAPAPAPAPVVEQVAPVSHELAFTQMPQILDEKAAARLEEHLLEMDPALKKGEAYFYARHCTMHMNYTIAQYKKALGCAYETARTSMEHLVELHYYEKAQVKNKFVYTPIKK